MLFESISFNQLETEFELIQKPHHTYSVSTDNYITNIEGNNVFDRARRLYIEIFGCDSDQYWFFRDSVEYNVIKMFSRWFNKEYSLDEVQKDFFARFNTESGWNQTVNFCRNRLKYPCSHSAAEAIKTLFDESIKNVNAINNAINDSKFCGIYNAVISAYQRKDWVSFMAFYLVIALCDELVMDDNFHLPTLTRTDRYLVMAYRLSARAEYGTEEGESSFSGHVLRYLADSVLGYMAELEAGELQKIAVDLYRADPIAFPWSLCWYDAEQPEPLFYAEFLENAAVLFKNADLPDRAEQALSKARAIRERWGKPKTFGSGTIPTPSVSVPGRDPRIADPIYSTEFDSVRSAAGSASDPLWRDAGWFQTLASGRTLVLGLSQVWDNTFVLDLLYEPCFRAAVREGFISTSLFQGFDQPIDYLKACLKSHTNDPGNGTPFFFSSCDHFNSPVYGARVCGAVLRGLENNLSFPEIRSQLPQETQSEIKRLYECYRAIAELFPSFTLESYSQTNPARPCAPTGKLSFFETVNRRIQYLTMDDRTTPVTGRAEAIKLLRECQQKLGTEFQNPSRSTYKAFMERGIPGGDMLFELASAVYPSYLGGLITSNVVDTASVNPLLRIHSDAAGRPASQLCMPFMQRIYQSAGGRYTIMEQDNIIKMMRTVRRLLSENPDSQRLQRETGLGFDGRTGLPVRFGFRRDGQKEQHITDIGSAGWLEHDIEISDTWEEK